MLVITFYIENIKIVYERFMKILLRIQFIWCTIRNVEKMTHWGMCRLTRNFWFHVYM